MLQHRVPVQAGHHHVQHHQVRVVLGDRGQRGVAVVGGHRLEAVEAQRRGDQVHHVLLVVDHQYPALGAGRGLAGGLGSVG